MATGNHFLDSLSPDDAQALRPRLTSVILAPDEVLIRQGEDAHTVHFPIGSLLANVVRLEDGPAVETALVGREGLSGLAPVMASAPCSWEVVARRGGEALSLPAEALRQRAADSASFRARLMVLTAHYQSQAAQTAACNGVHRLSQRLARWLLTAADLCGDDRVDLTQEAFAALLGARRTTVTEAATALKRDGALAYGRGRVRISDRARLEARACGCYRAERQRMSRLGVMP